MSRPKYKDAYEILMEEACKDFPEIYAVIGGFLESPRRVASAAVLQLIGQLKIEHAASSNKRSECIRRNDAGNAWGRGVILKRTEDMALKLIIAEDMVDDVMMRVLSGPIGDGEDDSNG